jgi:hypothetical protein
LHDIISDEFVLDERWIFEGALFCGMPRIRMLVITKEAFVVLIEGGRRRKILIVLR